ncbi:MAG TPA: GMC family oxidoreductase [bacterium]|nr:GMC family oxidoreductase [bacterium]
MKEFSFTPREREIVFRLGAALVPAGRIFPAYRREYVDRMETFLQRSNDTIRLGIRTLLRSLDAGAMARYLRPLGSLNDRQVLSFVDFLSQTVAPLRLAFRLVAMLIKASYFDNEEIFDLVGIDYRKPPVVDEPARWLQQVLPGEDIGEDMTLEAEVIVIGTGAGGAVVAAELAERGNAVLIFEEGDFHRRSEFSGRPLEMQRMMYRNFGLTATMGNASVLVPLGRAVGGTTVVNSGTCFRTPARTLQRWREQNGLGELTPAYMDQYFRRVEEAFQVKTADMKYVGPTGAIIGRGADKLGFHHGPLARNAPDCDGQGVCPYGCPTDAKRSTNISYIPRALNAGAYLVAGTKITQLLFKGKRVYGVAGRSRATGKRVVAKAPLVVLAAGALASPLLLMEHKIGNSSGQLGHNLSLHPASSAFGVMNETVEGWKHIPQGYMVDEFEDEGLMFEGAQVPFDIAGMLFPWYGEQMQSIMERFAQVSSFGFMIEDTSRGKVVRNLGDRPLVHYHLNRSDHRQLLRGHELLARIYLAAGAEIVISGVNGWRPMRNEQDLADNLARHTPVWDIDLSAYHPLGTCQMGDDPRRYVTDPYGEVYDALNLFVCDGSIVPPALGVNPQVTIAALATRTADYLHERINR